MVRRVPGDQRVVDRDLPEHQNHDGHGSDDHGPAIEIHRDEKGYGLTGCDSQEDRLDGVPVDGPSDDDLGEGGECVDRACDGPDLGRGIGEGGQPVIQYFR